MATKIRKVLTSDSASAVFPLFHKYATPTIVHAKRIANIGIIAICPCACNSDKNYCLPRETCIVSAFKISIPSSAWTKHILVMNICTPAKEVMEMLFQSSWRSVLCRRYRFCDLGLRLQQDSISDVQDSFQTQLQLQPYPVCLLCYHR